jgi:hypothetical protein
MRCTDLTDLLEIQVRPIKLYRQLFPSDLKKEENW